MKLGKQIKPASAFVIKLLRALLIPTILSTLAVIQPAAPARAGGPWYVTPGGNDGNSCLSPSDPCGTIQGAIGKASDPDTIYIAEGTYTGNGDQAVLIDKSLTLSGGWDTGFSNQTAYSTIDGENARRGVTVSGSETVIERFAIVHGIAPNGGGINVEGELTVYDSTIMNCSANWSGGGIYSYSGSITIDSSAINNNTAGTWGYSGGGGGGGIYTGSSTIIRNSSITNNQIYGSFDGSGIHSWGNLIIENSTIDGNHGGDGSGLYTFSQHAPIKLSSVTISGGHSQGIFNLGSTIELSNSLFSDNYIDIQNVTGYSGSIISHGYNLYKLGIGFSPASTDILGKLPILGALTGLPSYRPLLRVSQATNGGNPTGCQDHLGNILTTDQRGANRVGRCDIGAYEYDPATDPYNYVFLPCISKPCLIYSDDFSNRASGWPITDTGNTLYEYRSEEYRILVRPKNYSAAVRSEIQVPDSIITVDLRNINGTNGSYGIAFGISPDWSSLYSLEIYPNGWFGIYRYDSHGIMTLAEAFSPAIKQGTASNHIRVERIDAGIQAYANGELLASVYDGSYQDSGYLGLIVFSYNQTNVDVRFDNFIVYGTTCATPPAAVLQSSAYPSQIDPFSTLPGKFTTKQPHVPMK